MTTAHTKMTLGIVNILQTLIFVLVGLSAINSQDAVRGRLALLDTTDNSLLKCSGTSVGPTCVKCGIILTCLPGQTDPVGNTTCSTLDSSYNSCDENGSCATDAPTDASCNKVDFTCTSKGQFPDVVNCRRYYACNDTGATGVALDCPINYAYDSKSGLCTRSSCQTVDCSRSLNKYLLFPQDPSILVFCSSEGKAYMFRCADPQHMQYSLSTLKCSFNCPREGRFPEVSSCQRYYECYRGGRGYEYKLQQCPSGFGFNSTSQLCVLDSGCIAST